MKDLKEQVAYLKGLAEGLDLSEDTKEGKIIKQIIKVLEGVATSLNELKIQHDDLETYMESIDDDLSELEEDFYEDDEDDDDEEYDDLDFLEVKCPRCNDIVCFDADIIDDDDLVEVVCPHCNEVVFVNDGSYEDPVDWEDDEDLEEVNEEDDDEDF